MRAYLSDSELLRYSRQLMLPSLDVAGQLRLKRSKALIMGLGGLGAPVSLYLAAAGVGELHLVDDDQVDLTNLQRQILYSMDDLGKSKVEAALERLRRLNPDILLMGHDERLNGESLGRLVAEADLILDCSDNFATRDALSNACLVAHKPLVSGAAIGFDGQVAVFDHRQIDVPCYHCVYGDSEEQGPTCSEAGVLGPVTGMVGSIQALEAVKLLAGLGDSLAGCLLCIEGLTGRFREIRLQRDPDCSLCGGRT